MYWCKKKYIKKRDVGIEFFAHTHRFKSNDYIGTIRENVWILPTLFFQFNRHTFLISFCWVVFECRFVYVNFKKQDEICRIK